MGKLAEIKTKENSASVEDFINSIDDEQKRKDSFVLLELMKKVTGAEPKMWGSSLIGFGVKRYKSPNTGREVDWFLIGFSPRKANISLHLIADFNSHTALLEKLGSHKTSVGCLYLKKLDGINLEVLEAIMVESFKIKE
jgi:hypothetical protein